MGLLGVFGIWLTAGLALPFVNVLKMFSPEQLMFMRGTLTALMALVALRGIVGKVDKYTHLIALVIPFATFGLYQGVRTWGAGPTIIVVTTTPIINLLISLMFGIRISPASLVGLILMIGGVGLARWGGDFHLEGFLWTLLGTIANAILYELFGRAKSEPLQKCFWACTGMALFGLALCTKQSWKPLSEKPHLLIWVLGFAFVGGFLYWLANLMTFKHLPTTEASVLAQGETPAVIIGASLMLGEKTSAIQWIGVMVTIIGAAYLSYWLTQKKVVRSAPAT